MQNGSKLYVIVYASIAQRAQMGFMCIRHTTAFECFLYGFVVCPGRKSFFGDIEQRRIVLLSQRGRKKPCNHHSQIIIL